MKRIVLLFSLLLASLPLSAQEMVGGLIVKFQAAQPGGRVVISRQRLDTLSRAAGVALRHGRSLATRAELLHLPAAVPLSEARRISARLAAQPGVLYAEPDRRYHPLLLPNDTYYNDPVKPQWSLWIPSVGNEGSANLEAAWEITTGDANVVVAVVDTGILSHVDIDPARLVPGYDFIANDPAYPNLDFEFDPDPGRDADPTDTGDWVAADSDPELVAIGCPELPSSWHGSHVAGTIGANTNNALGVAGVTWTGKLLPLRALGKCGGLVSDITDAMLWAGGQTVTGVTDNLNPAQIVNLSLGGTGSCSQTEQDAIDILRAAGVLVVVAAGNENADVATSAPANCEGVLAVAAHGKDGQRAYYSNYGAGVHISAPGGDMSKDSAIPSTVNASLRDLADPAAADAIGWYQGTSMAAPHVAGIAALMHAAHNAAGYTTKPLSPDQIKREIQLTAAAFPAASDCAQKLCGAGLIDAQAAVAAVNGALKPVAVAQAANAASPVYDTAISVASGATVLLDGTQSSDDGAALSYSWQQNPADPTQVVISNGTTASASFSAPASGFLHFTLTVTDDQALVDSAQVSVAVNNLAPVLATIGNQRAAQGAAVNLNLTTTDPGDTLSYSATGLPAGATLTDNGDGTALISWPSADFSIYLSYPITVTVTDSGGLSDSETFTLSLDNVAPILQPISNVVATAGSAVSFQVIATDGDGVAPILSASGLPSGATFTDLGNGIGSFNWDSSVAGSYNVGFTATDAQDSRFTDWQLVFIDIQAPTATSSGGGGGGAFGPLWLIPLFALLRRRRRNH